MNIAICDDEAIDRKALRTVLLNYIEKTGASLILQEYDNATDLLRDLEHGSKFDVIFFDVLMPGFTGIQAARELRSKDHATELIFLTSAPDFALDAFSVKARDYLLKPVKEKELFRMMDELHAQLDEQGSIIIESKKGLRKLRYDRIEYCEAIGHHVVWHLRSGAILESRYGIQSVENMLSQSNLFLRVHRSFLVNIHSISFFDRERAVVQLESMVSIPIPKAKFSKIQQEYIQMMESVADL